MKRNQNVQEPKEWSAILLSVVLGGFYAGIYWICCDSGFFLHPYWTIANALVASPIGMIVGLLCSPFPMFWLARKRLAAAGFILLLVVGSAIPLYSNFGYVIGADSIFGHIGIIVAIYLFCCKAVSIYLPDIVFDSPNCLACGYDLTGNVSGVCPECGRAFDLATLPEMPGR